MWPWDQIRQLNRIENKLDILIAKENKMGATLDQVLQDVSDETSLEQSVLTLVGNIQDQLKAALAGTTISPANQAKIDSIFSGIESNKTALTAALTANTPVTPAQATATS